MIHMTIRSQVLKRYLKGDPLDKTIHELYEVHPDYIKGLWDEFDRDERKDWKND